jgi:hypothetical protein
MWKETPSNVKSIWVKAALLKTPAWIVEAAYSDFLMSDYAAKYRR